MKEDPEVDNDFEDVDNMHQIQNRYTFWYRGGTASAAKTQSSNYNDSIKKIANFQTVEYFWRIYDYLKRPNDFRFTTEYHLFKEGITPTWEDPQNKAGGKWMVRLKKGISSRYWEDVILAIIGEQFDVGPEICGAVLSVRNNEDIISIWNKSADNLEAVNKIRDQLHRVLRLPSVIQIEYKKHQDSLVDKSSYRNPSLVWRSSSTSARPPYTSSSELGGGSKPYNNTSTSGGFNRSYEGAGGHSKSGWKTKAGSESTHTTGPEGGNESDRWGGASSKPNKEYVPRGERGGSSSSDIHTGGGGWSNKPPPHTSNRTSTNESNSSATAPASSGGWRNQSSSATSTTAPVKNNAATNALKAAIAPPIPTSSSTATAGGGASSNAWTRSKPNITPNSTTEPAAVA